MVQCLTERHARAESQNVRQQPLVFTAPPPPALVQGVILARASMGPYSTSTAHAGQRHVILSMAGTAFLLSAFAAKHVPSASIVMRRPMECVQSAKLVGSLTVQIKWISAKRAPLASGRIRQD